MDDRTKAYTLAQKAAEIDFSAALQGLMAGHAEQINALNRMLTRKDAALLASLALSKKGARLGADGVLAKVVCDGITSEANASPIEIEFLQTAHPEGVDA